MGNVRTNVFAKFHCAALHIKKAVGIFRELIPTRTTRVAFCDPPPGSKNILLALTFIFSPMLTAGGDPCSAWIQVLCWVLLVRRLQLLSDGDQCRSTCWTDRRPCKTTVSKFTVPDRQWARLWKHYATWALYNKWNMRLSWPTVRHFRQFYTFRLYY